MKPRKLSRIDRAAWTEKTKRLNEEGMPLFRGDVVVDVDGHRGVVTRILPGTDTENHGTIYVWQMDRFDYGSDNCEHYAEINWRESLRVLDYKINSETLNDESETKN